MPAKGIHHVDLAVADVERSLAFYLALLGPLGWAEDVRYPTYRGTEEVVYLKDPTTGTMSGFDRPTAVSTAITPWESSTLRSRWTPETRSTPRTRDASRGGRIFISLPKPIATSRGTTHSSSSI